MNKKNFIPLLALLFLAGCANPPATQTFSTNLPDQIFIPNGSKPATVIKDLGPVDSNFVMGTMIMNLIQTPERKAAFEQRLMQQQNDGKWLVKGEFEEKYGVPKEQTQKFTEWLQHYGFTNIQVMGLAIDFRGTAGQLDKSFHTQIHHYLLDNGSECVNNVTNPQIPSEFSSFVSGFVSLGNCNPIQALGK
jgi:subtilase family serine protease